MKFSVLMSIYRKEKVTYFNRAMNSIWDEQYLKPNEIVLVLDGTLNKELYLSIDEWKKKLGNFLNIVSLEKNVGLGIALNEGLKVCNYELIARMDTDDISFPFRFEEQIGIFKKNTNIDVCSAWIDEFENFEENLVSVKKIPEKHNDIITYAKFRNPVNHIPSMFKKSAVEKVGGYKHMLGFEDYYLWIRMMMNGAKFYNIQKSLANIRVGNDMIGRRHGISYFIKEFKFLSKIKLLGFLTTKEFLKSLIIRFILRLTPKALLKMVYIKVRS